MLSPTDSAGWAITGMLTITSSGRSGQDDQSTSQLRQMQPDDSIVGRFDGADDGQLKLIRQHEMTSITTEFLKRSLPTQKSTLTQRYGSPWSPLVGDEIVGCATVSFETMRFDGKVLPSAFLENIKVHHDYRGHGIGSRMVQWLVDKAKEKLW